MFKRAFRTSSPHDGPWSLRRTGTRTDPSPTAGTHRRSSFRALVSILGSLSLVAALGVSVAGADPAPPPPNQDLGKACGLDFALVIDRSGSESGAATTVRNDARPGNREARVARR